MNLSYIEATYHRIPIGTLLIGKADRRKSVGRIGGGPMFRAISGHRVIDATFPRKRLAATRIYRYRRTPPVHLDVPPLCRHGIVRLIPWNRHVISWPGRLPAARRVAHANVPLMSLVLLRPPPRPFLLARPATSF